MNICLVAPLLVLGLATTAIAGAGDGRHAENDGVVLYLALAPELEYKETETYRGLSATPTPEEAMVIGEVSSHPQIAFVMAAYPPEAVPELQVATFGIRYPEGIRILRHGITHESLPMSTRDWPLSGEGLAIALLEPPDTSRVVELAWIAIVAEKPGIVDLVPHPDPRMAARVVSQTPRGQVPVAAWGNLGFGEEGSAPIPNLPGPELGAACVADTICLMLTEAEVDYYRTRNPDVFFLGEGTSCRDEAYCSTDAPRGACCLADESCRIITRKECAELGGRFLGEETQCGPDACEPPDPSVVPEAGGSDTEER